jgi:hypothetical protein
VVELVAPLLLVLLPLLLVLLPLPLLLVLLPLLLVLLPLLLVLLPLAAGGSLLFLLSLPPQADINETIDNMLKIAIRRTTVMIPPFNPAR